MNWLILTSIKLLLAAVIATIWAMVVTFFITASWWNVWVVCFLLAGILTQVKFLP